MFNKIKISFYSLTLFLLANVQICNAQKVFVNFNSMVHQHDTRFYDASATEIERVFNSSYIAPKSGYAFSIGINYRWNKDSIRIKNKKYNFFLETGLQLKHDPVKYPRLTNQFRLSKWMIEYNVNSFGIPIKFGIFPSATKNLYVSLHITPSFWWRKQLVNRSQFGGKQIDSFSFYAVEVFPSIGWQINKRFSIELYTRLVNFKAIDKILFDPEIYFPDPTERAAFEAKKYEWHNPFLIGLSISYAPFGRKPKKIIIVEKTEIVEEEKIEIKQKKRRRKRKRR